MERAIDDDRFASSLSLVVARTADGRLGSAFSALHHLRSLALDSAQLTALAEPSQQLENALAEACARVLQGLCRGAVLRTRDDVGRLLVDDARVLPLLSDALRIAGLAVDLLRPATAAERPAPIPVPLSRNREVRVQWQDQLHAARIVDSRSDQVTVRVQTAKGQAFPTVPVVACEPVEPSATVAVEMGFAALQANDVMTARLWLAVARLRSEGELAARGSMLLDWLK
jgi:hypothetical protein